MRYRPASRGGNGEGRYRCHFCQHHGQGRQRSEGGRALLTREILVFGFLFRPWLPDTFLCLIRSSIEIHCLPHSFCLQPLFPAGKTLTIIYSPYLFLMCVCTCLSDSAHECSSRVVHGPSMPCLHRSGVRAYISVIAFIRPTRPVRIPPPLHPSPLTSPHPHHCPPLPNNARGL